MNIRQKLFQRMISTRMLRLQQKSELYNQQLTPAQIVTRQLEQFNRQWQVVQSQHPFYQYWSQKHRLPKTIESIAQLQQFPLLTKSDINQHRELIFGHLKDYRIISTGGSSGETVKFPTAKDEKATEYANTYLGKAWWGIKPADPLLQFWGHSHLFGSGLKGKWHHQKRRLFDWLINTKRLNAYNFSFATMKSYYQCLIEANPVAIIGYSSNLYQMARYITDHQLPFTPKTKLKGVIVTSETISTAEIDLVEKVFQVPVILEYGMAETGVIAYSRASTQQIEFLWDSFIGWQHPQRGLMLTTLNPRLFPLINYDTTDLVTIDHQYQHSILSLQAIQGRPMDVLSVLKQDGGLYHLSAILMVHVLKSYPGIYAVSYTQTQPGYVLIRVQTPQALSASESQNLQQFFLQHLVLQYPGISASAFTLQRVESLPKTVAGKEQRRAVIC